jgi:serine/threonine-protein kinase SRPK3
VLQSTAIVLAQAQLGSPFVDGIRHISSGRHSVNERLEMAEYYVAYDGSNLSSCLNCSDQEGYEVIEEGRSVYSPGGMHPVQVGDLYGGKYEIIRKLGYGRESTVWLADDKTYFRPCLDPLTDSHHIGVALKVTAARAGTAELDNLLQFRSTVPEHPGHRHLPVLLDHFEHNGPNGSHSCLVFELLGESLGMYCRRMFSRNQLPPVLDKMVARQLITVLDFLHNICGFVHAGMICWPMANFLDINIRNVLISLPAPRASVEKILEDYPRRWRQGPWGGDPPYGWFASASSDDKTMIPGTSAHLMDSEPICLPETINVEDYPPLVVKLVGYGHGIVPIMKH